MELPKICISGLVKNPVAGIKAPMKTPGQAILQPHHLNAKVIKSLQVLERCRSRPAGLAAGDSFHIGDEAPIAYPRRQECNAPKNAEAADRCENQLAIS